MSNRQFLGFCMCIVFIASTQAQTEAEFAYDKNTFIKYKGCLGIYPGTSLELTQKVWIFSIEQTPVFSEVVHIIPAAEAQKKLDEIGVNKAGEDKSLWAKIGCAHSFRGDMPESLARVTPVETGDTFGLGFAIRGLPAGAWISEGRGDVIAMSVKDNPYVGLVRHLLTDACYASDSLIHVRQFPIRKGRAIIQLDIGKVELVSPEKRRLNIEEEMQRAEGLYAKWAWPEYKKEKLTELERKNFIESVEICRFFLDEKRIVKIDKFHATRAWMNGSIPRRIWIPKTGQTPLTVPLVLSA